MVLAVSIRVLEGSLQDLVGSWGDYRGFHKFYLRSLDVLGEFTRILAVLVGFLAGFQGS